MRGDVGSCQTEAGGGVVWCEPRGDHFHAVGRERNPKAVALFTQKFPARIARVAGSPGPNAGSPGEVSAVS